ncbi:MAG: rhomboid family intramembrane serine protease [Desulfobacter sp.]|nr:MAG: rhomboid family intramembrane serine protease [Desulfobacter sp.]
MPAIPPRTFINSIIWVNGILYLISLVFSGAGLGLTLNPLNALSPSIEALTFLGASGTIPIDHYQAWWTLLTANWLHGSLLHIIFNMIALRNVAPLVIHEFGAARMFSIYTLTGAAGFYLSYLGRVPLTIGASAGLCGLIGALLFFGKTRGGTWAGQVFGQTKAWIFSLVIIGFLIPNINNWGHGGGLAAGVVLAMVLGYNDRRRENAADKLLASGLGLATLFFILRAVVEGVGLILFG